MAIFRVPCQKHVIFPVLKFGIKILAKWRYAVCLVRNMSFIQIRSSKSDFWPNGDFPCALPETCHFSKFEVRNYNVGQMAIFRVPCQKHVIFPNFKFEIIILAKWRYYIPCALPETCHFSKFEVRNYYFGQMAIFRLPCQKHVIFPLS